MKERKNTLAKIGRGVLIIVAALLMVCGCDNSDVDTPSAPAAPGTEEPEIIDPEDGIEKAVTIGALMAHLEALAAIGHRAAGSENEAGAVAYIKETLSETSLVVTEQRVPFRYFEETAEPAFSQTSPSQTEYTAGVDFSVMTYSGAGDVSGELAFLAPQFPPGADPNASDDGCEPSDFEGSYLNGRIAVLQRGGCSYHKKAMNAQQNGAAAVLIFNEGQTGRTGLFDGSLDDDSRVSIPVAGIGYQTGKNLYDLSRTDSVTVHIAVRGVNEDRTGINLFAETPSGNAEQVVMAGAHLDTVSAGAGINDNGSGVAALTEFAYQTALLGYQPVNQMRFAWWTAKEAGAAGSKYYVYHSPMEDLYDIALYLDFDSIGSSNFVYGVLDGDLSDTADSPYLDPEFMPDGCAAIERAFKDYFAAGNLNSVAAPMTGLGDYDAFINVGIPAGGLFSGEDGVKTAPEAGLFGGTAGEPYDPCYHQACDGIDNISRDALLVNAKAAARTVQYFAGRTVLFDGSSAVRRAARPVENGTLSQSGSAGYDRFHGDRHMRSTQ